MPRAVVLLSGGLDSATLLAIALEQGFDCYALSFDYGQLHGAELVAAAGIAKKLGVHEHRVMAIPIGALGGSALTDNTIAIPDKGGVGIPVTYVPARNTVFLSLALAWAEVLDAKAIFIGGNAIDYSGYPDCRPEYIAKVNEVIKTHTNDIFVHAPIVYLTKADVVRLGEEVGVPWDKTWSCYRGGLNACGKCPSCEYRLLGFGQAGIKDPIAYDEGVETWPQKT